MMKKTILATILASTLLSPVSAQASTYFKLGIGALSHDAESGTIHNYNDGKNKAIEKIEMSGFGASSVIGLGWEFNDYLAIEGRYHIGISNKSEVDYRTNRGSFLSNLGMEHPSEYGEFSSLEEKNRFDLLLRFSTPSLLGVQPFINVGASTATIKVGSHSFNDAGLTAGAGFNLNFNENWSLSLEYMVYAPLEYVVSSKYESDNSGNSLEDPENKSPKITGHKNTKSEWIGKKAMISLNYKF